MIFSKRRQQTIPHNSGGMSRTIPMSFSCSKPRAVVSKMLLPIGCQMAKHITANEIPVAPNQLPVVEEWDLQQGTAFRLALEHMESAGSRSGVAKAPVLAACTVAPPVSIIENTATVARPDQHSAEEDDRQQPAGEDGVGASARFSVHNVAVRRVQAPVRWRAIHRSPD